MIKLVPDLPEKARVWRNDPKVYKWCRQYRPISIAEHERWLRKIQQDSTICMFGLETEDTIDTFNNAVGVAGFTSIDMHNRSAEFTLYIDPKLQGNGLGAKALLALVDHGFKEWGFNRIWGEVFKDNPAMKMFEYVGFRKEGKWRQAYYRDGEFIDSTMIAILSEDWNDSPPRGGLG
jgi:RimJ/RimL family protein N-acetyltransferase